MSGVRIMVAGLVSGALALSAETARADSAPGPDPFVRLAVADAVVLAVKTNFAPIGGHIRLTVYDNPERFLEQAATKRDALVNDDGLALIALTELAAGEYSFVAYLDENDDGRLNRNALGKPKEPYIFSNDVKPKLRKPTFDETKVAVSPGEVVVMTLKN